MNPFKTCIVDDERLARQRLRRMISQAPDFSVEAEFESAEKALAHLHAQPADVLFLDIQMPGLSGFDLLERLPATSVPIVVFVTAHDEYALRAFEVHAIDYLLKPFDAARLEKTLDRVRDLAVSPSGNARILQLLDELRQRHQEPARFAVKSPGRMFFVRQDEIDWIEAADNYVSLHVGKDSHLIRETMTSVESRLDSRRFLRIHRSTIVNADRIKELRPWFHGEYVVVLHDGTELTLSRTYREKILNLLGN
jgi:two-component system, LytTR family, response regulator